MAEAKKSKSKIRIKLRAYDHKVLDSVSGKIVEAALRTGAVVVGPIPLPTKIEKHTVIRSPHVDKISREQFEIRTHKRIIEIHNPNAQTVDQLKENTVPAGVHITLQA